MVEVNCWQSTWGIVYYSNEQKKKNIWQKGESMFKSVEGIAEVKLFF